MKIFVVILSLFTVFLYVQFSEDKKNCTEKFNNWYKIDNLDDSCLHLLKEFSYEDFKVGPFSMTKENVEKISDKYFSINFTENEKHKVVCERIYQSYIFFNPWYNDYCYQYMEPKSIEEKELREINKELKELKEEIKKYKQEENN